MHKELENIIEERKKEILIYVARGKQNTKISKKKFFVQYYKKLFSRVENFSELLLRIKKIFNFLKKKIRIFLSIKRYFHYLTSYFTHIYLLPQSSHLRIAFIMGLKGMGDLIVGRRVLEDMKRAFPHIEFDVFHDSASTAVDLVFPNSLNIFPLYILKCIKKKYDGIFEFHYLPFFYVNNEQRRKISLKMPNFLSVIEQTENRRKNYFPNMSEKKIFWKASWFIFQRVIGEGYNRHNICQSLLGIPCAPPLLDLRTIPWEEVSKFVSVNPRKYITIHNGYHISHASNTTIPFDTRIYPEFLWNKVICLIKAKFPTLRIIQLGANTSTSLVGVDLDLLNKTNFFQCAGIIEHSLLHIDVESGLVHVASALGVNCIVLFGPTPSLECGYTKNINIDSTVCGNCFSLDDRGTTGCPRQLANPECMSSIPPELVAEKAIEYITGQTDFLRQPNIGETSDF